MAEDMNRCAVVNVTAAGGYYVAVSRIDASIAYERQRRICLGIQPPNP